MKHTNLFLLVLLLLSFKAFAQTPGVIIERGDSVLNPDKNDFITASGGPLNSDGYDPDEFEIKMFGVPIFGDGEVLRDIAAGEACGVSDLALDSAGYALYAGYDNDRNLIFRFRLAGDKASVQSYSVLIDTDGLIGPDDPNAQGINPGFEIEITLIHRFGVYLFDIDGVESCPTPLRAYDVSTNQQKSISSELSCGDPDIYVDFYVPFSALEEEFGITADTELKFAGLTNISATCAIDGKISDIGGVDDRDYDGCFTCAMVDLVENQCPSTVNLLCETCAGFPEGATETPTINLPVLVGDTDVTGSAEPEADIFISVYDVDRNLIEEVTTASDIDGFWTSGTFSNSLNFEDSIVVNALLPGKCQSGVSDIGSGFAIVDPNQPPSIIGRNVTISYVENSPAVIVEDTATIIDDNDEMIGARVWISSNYQLGADVLDASPPGGITKTYDPATATITFSGQASKEDYNQALRSVTFLNTSDAPDFSIRVISFTVSDVLHTSQPYNKNLIITTVNDPPVIVVPPGPNGNPTDTLFVSTPEDTPVTICIGAQDVELDNLAIGSTTYDGQGEVVTSGGLCLLYTPSANYNGTEYFEVSVCDDGTPSLCDEVVVAVEVLPTNDPPVIIVGGQPVDSLHYFTDKNVSLEICLQAQDLENDELFVESAVAQGTTQGTIAVGSGLCIDYLPPTDFVGVESFEITVCDTGDPSRCAKVKIGITVQPTNGPPIITSQQDTVYVEVLKNNSIDICLDITDPDGNNVDFNNLTELLNVGGTAVPTYPCINYTPPQDFEGVDIIKVDACDDGNPVLCDEVFIKISVLPVNNPPYVIVNGVPADTVRFTTKMNVPLEACLDVADPDNDNVAISGLDIEGSVGQAVINATCLQYSPETDYTGDVWITTTLCDDGSPSECSEVIVYIEVQPVNSPPVIVDENNSSIDSLFFQIGENEQLEFCLNVNDPDNDLVNVEEIRTIDGLGFYFPGADDLCFVFIPEENQTGTDTHLITVVDNGNPNATDSILVKIEILPLNTPPVLLYQGQALDTIRVSTLENTPIDICLAGQDSDGDELTATELKLVSGEGNVSLSQNVNDFCVTYDPALNYFGQTWVSLEIQDNGDPLMKERVVIGIDVENVNQKPEVIFENAAVDTLHFSVAGRSPLIACLEAVDKDGDAVSIDFANLTSANATINPGASNLCFEYTPDDDYLGDDYFPVQVCDNGDPSLCDTVIAHINVFSTNTPPEFRLGGEKIDSLYLTVIETFEILQTLQLLDNENDEITISGFELISGSGNLNVARSADDLNVGYVPEKLSIGLHLIQIEICDNGLPGLCSTMRIFIDVTPQELIPYEALSPNGDGFNDFWLIQGIEHYPSNQVRIFDRWNNMVFSVDGYNNLDKAWTGQSNRGVSKKDLANGTYFYKITPGDGMPVLSGMIVLKR